MGYVMQESLCMEMGRRECPLLRQDLIKPATLVSQFLRIRNILAGQAEGMTIDQTLASQIIDLLICKMYDEQRCLGDEPVRVQVLPEETSEDLLARLNQLFNEVKMLPDVGALFNDGESLNIPAGVLSDVVRILQPYELTDAGRDVIGEAFESFIGPSLRGEEGQFFTPRNVVRLTCKMLDPKPGEIVVDPACGTGGFLTQVIQSQKMHNSITAVGVDKDCFLARVTAIQIGLLRKDQSSWAFCANSLAQPSTWPSLLQNNVPLGSVSVVMTNPPFGSRISVNNNTLAQFELGRVWKRKPYSKEWYQAPVLAKERPPQILFIERCLDLLRPGGRMGIILPDGVLGNLKEGYVRYYVSAVADVVAIVDLPIETFLPSTSTKTSLLFLRKKAPQVTQQTIFMAIAHKCGHDRRGKPIYDSQGLLDDDLDAIGREFRLWSKGNAPDF